MEHAAQPSPADALALQNERLRQEVAHLKQQVAHLTEQLAAAFAEIERLKRAGKRQATPFSKGTRVAKPKKPGRKGGQGRFCRREAPAPRSYTREVPVRLTQPDCPECGGALTLQGVETVTVTDLPPVVRPEVTAYHLEICQCAECGRRLRATHPEVPLDQRGATAHRVGPRVMALAHWLHYALGFPCGKCPRCSRPSTAF